MKNEASPISFLSKSRRITITHTPPQLNDTYWSEVMSDVGVDSRAVGVGGRDYRVAPRSYRTVQHVANAL
jgi:hypothetical protein